MRCIYFFAVALLIFSCDNSSNIKPPYNNYFFKYFGGEGNQKAVDLLVADDGTFYLLGNSQAPDSAQKIYLAHVDAQGRLIRENTFAFSDKIDLNAKDFLLTSDGKLAVVANKMGANSEVVLIRFSTDLLTPVSTDKDIVTLRLEFSSSSNVYANSITELNDGGFVVMGYTDYVNNISGILYDAVHFRTSKDLVQFTSTFNDGNGWTDIDGNSGIGSFEATNKGIAAFQQPNSNYEFIYLGTMNATKQNRFTFWSFSRASGSYPNDTSLKLTSNQLLTSGIKTTDPGYLMTGLSISTNNAISIKLSRSFKNFLVFDSTDFNRSRIPNWLLGTYNSTANMGTNDDLFATACNSSTNGGAFIVSSNIYNQSKDVWLMKFGATDLSDFWPSPVVIGGDGDDSAAAVAELTDGRIILLATMSVGSPNGGVSANQNKIALLKLNNQGRLSD